MTKNGFGFGRKNKTPAVKIIIKRLHADGVARQKKFFLKVIPNRESKNTVQAGKTGRTFSGKKLQKRFSIGMRTKLYTLSLEFLAKLRKIIKLAVINHGVSPVRRGHGLMTRWRGINNRQTPRPQRNSIGGENTFVIRPAMAGSLVHFFHKPPVRKIKAVDGAHKIYSIFFITIIGPLFSRPKIFFNPPPKPFVTSSSFCRNPSKVSSVSPVF